MTDPLSVFNCVSLSRKSSVGEREDVRRDAECRYDSHAGVCVCVCVCVCVAGDILRRSAG